MLELQFFIAHFPLTKKFDYNLSRQVQFDHFQNVFTILHLVTFLSIFMFAYFILGTIHESYRLYILLKCWNR